MRLGWRHRGAWTLRLPRPEGWLELPQEEESGQWAVQMTSGLVPPGASPVDEQRLGDELAWYARQAQREDLLDAMVYVGEARDWVHVYLRARRVELPLLFPPSPQRFARYFRAEFVRSTTDFDVSLVELPCGPAVRRWVMSEQAKGYPEEAVSYTVRPKGIRDAIDVETRWSASYEPAPMRASYVQMADEIARDMTIDTIDVGK